MLHSAMIPHCKREGMMTGSDTSILIYQADDG